MIYGYYICPTCKDKLIEKNVQCFEHCEERCNKCGNGLRLAFTGQKKIDDTIYEIQFASQNILNKKKYAEVVSEICHCEKEIIEGLLKEGHRFSFKGDAFHTYINMELLDEMDIVYKVSPHFPFMRRVYVDCPHCGNSTVYKTEEAVETNDKENYMQVGFFCEKCNQWVAMTYMSKIDIDETAYNLEIHLEKCDNEMRENIKKMVNELSDKRVFPDKIIICDNACNIHPIIEKLGTEHIDYFVQPPYPHRIAKYEKAWTEEDIRALREMNSGLKISLEEMNSLTDGNETG